MNSGMKKFIYKYFILFIIVFAFLLRVYRIGSIPPSLSWDEVSIGYNAYSILKTGFDEHHHFMPLDTFVAYGDYKPPLAIYLTVPAVAFFGLTEFAVRLPSAFFGTLTVALTYFLVLELLKGKGRKEKLYNPTPIALLSTIMLTISPWHINLSRAGFEANIALFFVVLGVLTILKTRENAKLWFIALIPFVLAMYTFNSARYFVVIMVFGLIWMMKQDVRRSWKMVASGICIALFLLAPLLPHLLSKEARLRYEEVNIFTDMSVVTTANMRIAYEKNAWWSKILNNRRVGYFRSYLIHYFDHFEPQYLFIRGDGNPKFSIQDVGQLYFPDAVFLIAGILTLFASMPATAWFLIYWMMMAIVPAAVARETPHALRTLNTLPTWQIFIAFGLYEVIAAWLKHAKSKFIRYAGILGVVVLYVFSLTYYLHNYYRHYPKAYSHEWQYGYREAIEFAKTVEQMYNNVYVSDAIGRPYMYVLFYKRYDPNKYLNTKQSYFDASGFYHVDAFDKYVFVSKMKEDFRKRVLYILPPYEVPFGAHILKTINRLDGIPALTIFEM